MCKKGNIPWNKNKKGLQTAWNKGLPKEQQPHFGKKQTEECKRKSYETKIKNNPSVFIESGKRMGVKNKGRKRLIEEREKISKTMSGRIRPKEHCDNISKTWTNRRSKIESSEDYGKIHTWLFKNYGKAAHCENFDNDIFGFKCKGNFRKFEWANKRDKPYEKNIDCFFQLCSSCHQKYDRLKQNIPII